MAAKKKTNSRTKSTASKKKASGKKVPAKKAPSRKKASAKTTTRKRPAAKKSPAKKEPAAKKPAAKKAARKTPAAAKKTVAKKKAAGKAASQAKKSSNGKKPVAASDDVAFAAPPLAKGRRSTAAPSGRQNMHLTAKELRDFRQRLLNLRDQVVDEISFLANDNLSAKQIERTGEEGTDNFNREFALKLVSSEQDIIYEIDEALRRIKSGTYGICEFSGEKIEKERLKVVPHARHSVKVQSELEKGRARYRPFGPSLARP